MKRVQHDEKFPQSESNLLYLEANVHILHVEGRGGSGLGEWSTPLSRGKLHPALCGQSCPAIRMKLGVRPLTIELRRSARTSGHHGETRTTGESNTDTTASAEERDGERHLKTPEHAYQLHKASRENHRIHGALSGRTSTRSCLAKTMRGSQG